MKAKSADQSVREALQVLKLATLSRQPVVVDNQGKLVYARAASADGSGMDALKVLTAKIEQEMSRHAQSMSEVHEHLIPKHLPSLASVKATGGAGMLAAIEQLSVEWHDFVKVHDSTSHREWQQTQLRRHGFLNRIDQSMPLGIKCSAEDGVVAAGTFTLSPDDTRLLLDRLTNSPYNQIDPAHGIALQTVKDAPRTESIQITLPGSADGQLKPSVLKLRFPTPEALVAALKLLYDRQQEIMRAPETPERPGVRDDSKANFVKLASLLTNQTAMILLDDFRYQASGGASDSTVIFNTQAQSETTLISIDAKGDLTVDRARWERWSAFIDPDISQRPLQVNRGANWEGQLDDTNFSYRARLSLKLKQEDIVQGVFHPQVTQSPQLSACLEMDWPSIDPVLKRAADDRRPRTGVPGQELSPRG